MRGDIHPLVQDAHHIHKTYWFAREKYQVRTYDLFAVTHAYVLCALPGQSAVCHRGVQPFTGQMNRQNVGISLISAPLAIAVVPNIG